jgi:hypothetical protein
MKTQTRSLPSSSDAGDACCDGFTPWGHRSRLDDRSELVDEPEVTTRLHGIRRRRKADVPVDLASSSRGARTEAVPVEERTSRARSVPADLAEIDVLLVQVYEDVLDYTAFIRRRRRRGPGGKLWLPPLALPSRTADLCP